LPVFASHRRHAAGLSRRQNWITVPSWGIPAPNEERIMKKIQSLLVSAALTIGMAAPASAAQSDPEVIIYRFPGVLDNGAAANAGVATVFHCTNFSGVTEDIRFATRNSTTSLVSNMAFQINHLQTLTASTHLTAAYSDVSLATLAVLQGTTAIAATSINIICTAETIDASTVAPVGVARRGIRFNPVPGSQE
jgi:hypothetical protein